VTIEPPWRARRALLGRDILWAGPSMIGWILVAVSRASRGESLIAAIAVMSTATIAGTVWVIATLRQRIAILQWHNTTLHWHNAMLRKRPIK